MRKIQGIPDSFSLRVVLSGDMFSQLIEAAEGSDQATLLFDALDQAFMEKFLVKAVPEEEYIRKNYRLMASRLEIIDGTPYVAIDFQWFEDEIVYVQ